MNAISEEKIIEVSPKDIEVSPFQPRRTFSDEELEDLSASILEIGILQPPVVRRRGDGKYELIAGERRLRASQQAGVDKIPVILRDMDDYDSANAALAENVQRVDLNPIEVAKALKALMNQQGLGHKELAKKIGKKRSTVANFLRLLGLPIRIQDSLTKGGVTMGHAKVILSVEGAERQQQLHDKVVRDGLSVRAAEQAALQLRDNPVRKQPVFRFGQDEHLQALEQAFQHRLGTKVKIVGAATGSGNRGKIEIDYYSLDDLDRVMELLQVEI